MELDRAQSEHAHHAHPGNSSLFSWGFQWGTTFFLLPALISLSAAFYVLAWRRSVSLLIVLWFLSWPIGFFSWILLWYTLGSGTGLPAASTIAMSCIGWVLFWAGAFRVSRTKHFDAWSIAMVLPIISLSGFKFMRPDDTTLITLSLAGIFVGIMVVGIVAWMKTLRTSSSRMTSPLETPAMEGKHCG